MKPVVVLVGPPGAGKSTVAALLADRLKVAWRDTDTDIEAAQGCTVQDIFVDRGEAGFRQLEHQAVAVALAEHDGVLSLGGGAVVDEGTRRLLGDHTVAFLDVGVAAAANRVGLNTARPLLLGNVRGQLKKLMDERRPLYRQVADIVVETDRLEPTEVADRIEQALGERR